jgi:hypothetical protein
VYENVEGQLTTAPVWQCANSYQSVVEELVWADTDNHGVRHVRNERKQVDGMKKVFYLHNFPVHHITSVTSDGEELSFDQYCCDPACGWISLSTPPQQSLKVTYSYSITPDLGVSNWDRENYIFSNTNSELPPVSVAIAPVRGPLHIPSQGGTFTYRGTVANNLNRNIEGDIWVMVRLPNEALYGPVFKQALQLKELEAITIREFSQDVPSKAPDGTYEYIANVGKYPSVTVDSSSFTFTKG